jgi:hypothetical protein
LFLQRHLLSRRVVRVRTGLVTTFHETLNYCFTSVLEMMGTSVREVVLSRLERYGIPSIEVSTRFDEVVRLLNESFGGSARIIIYKTILDLHQQYSMRADFTYQDSLKDHLDLLRERVITDHLTPKRVQRDDDVLFGKAPLLQSAVPAR